MCTCFGFKAEPIMGLGCVYVCVYVFALGLAGFGLGLVNVCFGFQAEPVMGLWCVCLLWVWSGLGRVWCVCFGFRAEPIMGLRFVFAFDLVWAGFGVCLLWVPS